MIAHVGLPNVTKHTAEADVKFEIGSDEVWVCVGTCRTYSLVAGCSVTVPFTPSSKNMILLPVWPLHVGRVIVRFEPATGKIAEISEFWIV